MQTQIEDIKNNNNKDQILSKQLNIKSLRESINASNERQDVLQANCFDRRGDIKLQIPQSAEGYLEDLELKRCITLKKGLDKHVISAREN